MKSTRRIIASFMFILPLLVHASDGNFQGCSTAGTASVVQDSICPNAFATLTLFGYVGDIQWQNFDGTNWIDETAPGATTDTCTVTLALTTDFRAVVTEPGCPSDTSNVITVTVGLTPPTTTGGSRCGYGPVNLTATGGGPSINWYDVPTGGSLLGTGSSFTPNVAATTTFYAASASGSGANATTTMPPQTNTYTPQVRGYWFSSPIDFTITGLMVSEPANGATQHIAVVRFVPVVAPPIYPLTTNDFVTLFVTQNNANSGVIPVNIPIAAGEIIGILGQRGANVNSYGNGPYVTTIDGNNVTLNRMGMQYPLSTTLPQEIFSTATGSISRVEMTYEVGCESGRTPAIATITPSTPISINASPPALCQGQTSNIAVSSTNPNYNYTWSPATGLSGTTGTANTATPNVPTTYTIVADDGTCGAIDSVFIDVGPASASGTAAISTDTLCLGTSAFLTLAGYTGNIQWQGNDGTGWINETGTGNTTDNYEVSPAVFMQYRAVVISGGCDPDTSTTLSVSVLSIVDPTTTNDTICAPGFASLAASGSGTMNWFTSPSGGVPIHVGNGYSPNVSTTTTYYVQASAGGVYMAGPASLGIGSQAFSTGNDFGIQFDVIQQCVLERVYVSPAGTTGNIIVNLRDAQGGPILNTATIPVNSFSGLTPVFLGFTLNPGSAYRLELGAGSVDLYYNTSGSAYPYIALGNPVTITGSVTPGFNTGPGYYFFYNWEVKVGCSSNLIPVTAFVNTLPAVPVISQNGTILTSSAPSNNQWYINGIAITGATGTTFDMTNLGSGSYTVTVTIDGCSSTSQPVIYTSIKDLSSAGIKIYPNPVHDRLTISFEGMQNKDARLRLYNSVGALLLSEDVKESIVRIPWNWSPGMYTLEIRTNQGVYKTIVVKQ